jgi:hypothetical protein
MVLMFMDYLYKVVNQIKIQDFYNNQIQMYCLLKCLSFGNLFFNIYI